MVVLYSISLRFNQLVSEWHLGYLSFFAVKMILQNSIIIYKWAKYKYLQTACVYLDTSLVYFYISNIARKKRDSTLDF